MLMKAIIFRGTAKFIRGIRTRLCHPQCAGVRCMCVNPFQ